MPDDTLLNPCTRCRGSGTDPEGLVPGEHYLSADGEVYQLHLNGKWWGTPGDGWAIDLETPRRPLRRLVPAAAEDTARVTFLSAALRDILGRFSEPTIGDTQIWRARNDEIESWRKILDGES